MSDVATVPAAALMWVPGLETGVPPLRLEPLAGGSVNQSWRVDTAQGRFVLRVNGPVWSRPGVDRVREHRLHAAAAAVGMAPRIIVAADAAGVQVREFLSGRTWLEGELSQPAQLERLGARLAQLHRLAPPPEVALFDPCACAQQYLRLIGPQSNAAAELTALVSSVQSAAAEVGAAAGPACIVHGDLMHGNILDGADLWLLDWEYAQIADPIYDVACVLAYYPEAWPHRSRLLAAAGMEGPVATQRLGAAVLVYRNLTELWHLVRDITAKTGVLSLRSAN